MKTMCCAVGLAVVSVVMCALAIGQDDAEKKDPAVEQIVVPTEDTTEFTVDGRSTLFRLTVTTPAGGSIEEPVIIGKARHLRTAEITNVSSSGPSIGAMTKEFVFRGTAAGKVEIKITHKGPATTTPVVEVFRVTIK
jgi:ABC-type phosphate transport system substrate-binding protein